MPEAFWETTAASTPAPKIYQHHSPQALLKPGATLPLSRSLAAPPSSVNPWGCFCQLSPLSSLWPDPRVPPVPSSSPRKRECVVPVTHARVFALLPGESSSVAHSAVTYQKKALGALLQEKKRGEKKTNKPRVITWPWRVLDQRGSLIIHCIDPSRERIASYQSRTYRRLASAP